MMKTHDDKFNGLRNSVFQAQKLTNGASGYYFVSISTLGRKNYFGRIITHNSEVLGLLERINPADIDGIHIFMGDSRNPDLGQISSADEFGEMIREITESEPEGNSLLHLDIEIAYTKIGEMTRRYWEEIPKLYPYVSLDATILMPDQLQGILRFEKPADGLLNPEMVNSNAKHLDMVIKGFKGAVNNYAKKHNIEFQWQSRYFDNHLKTRKEIEEVRQYIMMNPLIWAFTNQEDDSKN